MSAHAVRARRVAILWEHLSGYAQAAVRAVAELPDTRVLVVQRSREPHAAFALSLPETADIVDLSRSDVPTDLVARVREFNPDVALITTNDDLRYHAVASDQRQLGRVVVWASDIPPRAFWRDGVAMVRGRTGALAAFDAALVPGVAGRAYARRVGFADARIFEGLYTCDAVLFRPVGQARHQSATDAPWPPVFLFVGQFIPRKGVDTLLDAYRRYRAASSQPWELWCVGAGPLRDSLTGQAGLRVFDFADPASCAAMMGEAGALVLPSRLDHWGVVIHEAACAGLPVIASRESHASADLVEDGRSGFLFSAGDVDRLAALLAEAASHGSRLRAMGARSLALSERFDPTRFAQTLTVRIPSVVRGD